LLPLVRRGPLGIGQPAPVRLLRCRDRREMGAGGRFSLLGDFDVGRRARGVRLERNPPLREPLELRSGADDALLRSAERGLHRGTTTLRFPAAALLFPELGGELVASATQLHGPGLPGRPRAPVVLVVR
jgi:hypothetical protein